MADQDFSILFEAYYAKLQQVDTTFVRYIYNQINWDAKLIGIKGARGVGKTTLLIQRIKLKFGDNYDKAFYASLDNLWFNDNSLLDLVRHLNNHGIKHLFLDEIHKLPNWAQYLKNIYDMFPTMNIVYTGSSLLEIDNSNVDLSRRQTLYTMLCMSFREYMEYEGIIKLEPLDLSLMLNNHVNIANEITSKVDILKHFNDYLRNGCYPYYKISGKDFPIHLRESARLVIDSDVPATEPFEYQTLEKMKRLLMIMAKQVPFVPNIKTLCEQISTTRNLGMKLLYLLDKASLFQIITEKMKSYKNLAKPEKVLFANTNLMYAFSTNPDVGTLRETFFTSQISSVGTITSPASGDYLINENLLFEVGGRGKTFDQIKDIPNSYLAIDDTPVGHGNRIPLWMFGLLY